jgi:hypothetical protein
MNRSLPAEIPVAGRNEAQSAAERVQGRLRQAFDHGLAVIALSALAHDEQMTRWPESVFERLTPDHFDRVGLDSIPCRVDAWFHKRNFEGCSFINVLLESKADSPIRYAAAAHLSKIRAIVRALANDANLREPEKFAQAKCSHRPLRDEGCRLGPIGDETGDANKPEFKVRAWRSFRLSVE